jgi:hypothetical protein
MSIPTTFRLFLVLTSELKFVFFLYLRLSASSKENDLPLCIYFWYQTDSGVPNTLTPEVEFRLGHRNHVNWRTKITKFWRNGNDSKQPNNIGIIFHRHVHSQTIGKKILAFSVKDRYQINYFICIKDFNAETNTSLKLNLFSFFIWQNFDGIEMIRNNQITLE